LNCCPCRIARRPDVQSRPRPRSLGYLDRTGTEVTDAGLAHLTGLSKLSDLQLSRTLVTDGGVNELQQALPNLKIVR
jgi:internalin A